MKLRKILDKVFEGVNDVQGIVSPDGESIELNIPTKRPYKIKEKVPYITYVKFKNGSPVREMSNIPDDNLPIIDKKQQKTYTDSNEYWVKVQRKKSAEKTSFENIVEKHILRFSYRPYSDPQFTIRDDKNRTVGAAVVADSEDKKSIHIFNVFVDEEYRGRGVANAFYDFIEKKLGKKITRDTKGLYKALSSDGAGLWKRRNSKQS